MSKVETIESILKRHSPLTATAVCRELWSMGITTTPNNVRALMAQSFKRFVSLTPGLWQLQDPAMSLVDRVLLYQESRGGYFAPGDAAVREAVAKVMATGRAPKRLARYRVAPAKRRTVALVTEPGVTALEVKCARCHERDVVAGADNWTICLGCGRVGG